MSETIAFIVHLPARHEHAAQLERGMLDVLDAMQEEPDFVSTHLHQAPDDPDTFVLYEVWSCSREHFLQHHLGKSYRQAFEAALPQWLRAERTIEFLDLKRGYARA
ncbi:antibiotic biosynthesis monooxygenase [Dyella sp. C11]|uniref:putative quinol monooxygenase n=1 Tax=Dyella sp. C11 TaxID=2126991 RepID=UPI000D65509E|nr:antibiotic biosynthesis monooxygenase [Dyella sp. C11]